MLPEYLILSNRISRDREILEQAGFWSGVTVITIDEGDERNVPSQCEIGKTALWGGTTFCRRIAETLGGFVLEPADDFLPETPQEYVNRRIDLMPLAQARRLTMPKFVKPVNDKHFPAAVYPSGAELPRPQVGDETPVLVSDPVAGRCEYRIFARKREVLAGSVYRRSEGNLPDAAEHAEALSFAACLMADRRVALPEAVVIDVGWIEGAGWSVVEANPAVMSSLYDCEPPAVLEVLAHGIGSATIC